MRIRLHEPAFINGVRHDRGAIVDLPDGVKGPHRAVQKTPHLIDYDPKNGIDANHTIGEFVNVPLYDEVKE